MVNPKQTSVNIVIFIVCFIICLLLFSLENNTVVYKPSNHKNFESFPQTNNWKLFDLDFKYLINNNVCSYNGYNEEILAVIVVTSYYGDVETRSAMRRTFSAEDLRRLKLRRVFSIAIGSETNKFDIKYNAILNENKRFHDLIQGNFIEAYRNLTYKHIMGLHWASTYCKKAKYIIKMDDDIVFDMNRILKLLNNLNLPRNNQIAGYVFNNLLPIREPANKWFVTKNEYQKTLYPPFVSGWFYVTTPKTARNLVEKSSETPYFWIDDVYVTGILAKKFKIKHYNLNKIFAVHSEYIQCCIRDVREHSYECDYLIGSNDGDSNLFYTFNKVLSKCQKGKCVPRPKGKYLNNTCVAERKIYIGRGKALIEPVHLF